VEDKPSTGWALAETLTKGLIYLLARAAFTGGSCGLGILTGSLTYMLYLQAQQPGGQLWGMTIGIVAFFAGMAGREYATQTFLIHLLPKTESKDETRKSDQ
jgi:hypothetical protein